MALHNYSGVGMFVRMDEYLGTSEVANVLGVSERRVRAMIADKRLPARRMLGRWAIPAKAVTGFGARSAGRPLSESAAWAVLGFLSGAAAVESMPTRLRDRVLALPNEPNASTAQRKLQSWMAARGSPIDAWGPPSSQASLAEDNRVVLSGDRAVRDLQPSEPLRVYAADADINDLIGDHSLRRTNGAQRMPNVVLWLVDDLAAIPRSPTNPRHTAAPVAALDLLNDGDPRASRIAEQILAAAIGTIAALNTDPTPAAAHTTYADRRPHALVDDLAELRGPVNSVVELPLMLHWGPKRRYDLSSDGDRRSLYERVLNEALHPEQLHTYLNAELLLELWPRLWLPPQVRTLWEKQFPQLASTRPAAPAQ